MTGSVGTIRHVRIAQIAGLDPHGSGAKVAEDCYIWTFKKLTILNLFVHFSVVLMHVHCMWEIFCVFCDVKLM